MRLTAEGAEKTRVQSPTSIVQGLKAARELTQAIYRVTAEGKFAKDFGLPHGTSLIAQGRGLTC